MAESSEPEESESTGERFFESAKLFEQPLLGLIGALALVFGFIGYRQYFRSIPDAPSGWVDVLYADMQLVKLTSKVTTGTAPWTLNVGRLLAPLVTGYAAFRGVASLHRERLDRIRVRRSRGHVIVVGATSAALAVTHALRRQNRRVVVIDNALTSEQAFSLRSAGVFTVKGDPRRIEVLHEANVRQASEVLALTDDDALNIDIALRSHGEARATGSVSRADLCELLRIEALGTNGSPRLDFLNADELCARTIDQQFAGGLIGNDGDLLIAAPAILASQLLARAARCEGTRRTIRVVGPDASHALTLATRRTPRIAEALDVQIEEIDLQTAGVGRIAGIDAITRLVVGGEGTETVALALALARRAPRGAELVLAIPNPEHLAPLLRGGASTRDVVIRIVDSISWWADADLVLGGTVEVIARATHANYLRARQSGSEPATSDPAMAPWTQLSRRLKDSNRNQARHLWTKLTAVDCMLAPASGRADPFTFTVAEVEQLAELEHGRWVQERRADGWTSGPRDVEAKHTPHLGPWSDLSEEVRDLDRITITGLPGFLADVGYEIVRTDTASQLEVVSR